MEDAAYRIIIMAQADQALHHIVLHVKQSFSNEIAKDVYQEIKDRILLLADNPYMGAALAEKFEITTDVRYFVVSKQLIFYRVDEENSAIEILRVLDGRTDYLSVLFG